MQYPQALKAHRDRMREAGFKRLSCEIHPDLSELIERERRPGECGGRCLERLLLGEARPRPAFNRAEFGEAPSKDASTASHAGEWKAAWQAQQAERIRVQEERIAKAKAARQAEATERWGAYRGKVRAEAEARHGVLSQ